MHTCFPLADKRVQPVIPHAMTNEDEEDTGEDRPPNGKRRGARAWVKGQDISTVSLPAYVHPKPHHVLTRILYFTRFFTEELVDHIAFQTNLYARKATSAPPSLWISRIYVPLLA